MENEECCEHCGTDKNVECVEIEYYGWLMMLCDVCEEEYR